MHMGGETKKVNKSIDKYTYKRILLNRFGRAEDFSKGYGGNSTGERLLATHVGSKYYASIVKGSLYAMVSPITDRGEDVVSDWLHFLSLRKLLFIESLDAYYAKDGWPAENERK